MESQEQIEPEPVFYSQVTAAAMALELGRLRGENERLQTDVDYWQGQTNHWYMRATYTPAQIAEFIRRRSMTIDDNGEWLPLPEEERASQTNSTITDNGSIHHYGATGRPEGNIAPAPTGRAERRASRKGRGMGYITRTGNLAGTPTLHEGDRGPYTYARILVNDSVTQGDGSFTKGPTIAYDVAVSGGQARELVATAERSGNVRVMFSGRYRVTEWVGEKGAQIRHEVRADQVGVSLRGQSVTVERRESAGPVEVGDDTPF